jgi:hypothetical protein
MESGSPFTLDGPPTGVFTSSASILDNSPLALLNNSFELRCSSDWKNASRLTFMYTMHTTHPVPSWILECNVLHFQHVLSHIY